MTHSRREPPSPERQESAWPCQTFTPETRRRRKAFPGAVVTGHCLRFDGDGETGRTRLNVYEAVFDAADCRFGIQHSSELRSPWVFLGSDGPAVVMNAGFCFVADQADLIPPNPAYHFQVTGRRLLSLPTKTRTALLVQDGHLRPARVAASGWLRLGQTKIDWIGNHESPPANPESVATVFSLANQILRKDDKGIVAKTTDGLVRRVPGRRQIILRPDQDGGLAVATITDESVPVMAAAAVLQVPKWLASRLCLGDRIEDWSVGGIRAGEIDAAVTVGVELGPDPVAVEAAVEAERLVMTRRADGEPFYRRLDAPKARAAAFETVDGRLHFLIVDARPAEPGRRGVTLGGLAVWLHRRYDIRWAVAVDGGQSAKICWSDGARRQAVGNMHYLNQAGSRIFWDGWRGRPIASCIAAWPAANGLNR